MLLNPTDTAGHYRITSVFISWLGAALGIVSGRDTPRFAVEQISTN